MPNHNPSEWCIEPLTSEHDRSGFSCGVQSLDQYFQKQIERDVIKETASAFLLLSQKTRKVSGYYTLSVTHLEPSFSLNEMTPIGPRYQRLPATLLSRLAVDTEFQKKGLGKVLLMDALLRSYKTSRKTGSLAFIISAMIEHVEEFYEQFGFQGFPSQQQEMFLPMEMIGRLLEGNA